MIECERTGPEVKNPLKRSRARHGMDNERATRDIDPQLGHANSFFLSFCHNNGCIAYIY